jgi:hypothetical protein
LASTETQARISGSPAQRPYKFVILVLAARFDNIMVVARLIYGFLAVRVHRRAACSKCLRSSAAAKATEYHMN